MDNLFIDVDIRTLLPPPAPSCSLTAFQDLPRDILYLIIQCLSRVRMSFPFRVISRAFHRWVWRCLVNPRLTETYPFTFPYIAEYLHRLEIAPYLKRFTFEKASFSTADWLVVESFPSLESLTISGIAVPKVSGSNKGSIDHIPAYPEWKHAQLGNTINSRLTSLFIESIGSPQCIPLSRLTGLVDLKIQFQAERWGVSHEICPNASFGGNLRSLHLQNFPRFSTFYFPSLSLLTSLYFDCSTKEAFRPSLCNTSSFSLQKLSIRNALPEEMDLFAPTLTSLRFLCNKLLDQKIIEPEIAGIMMHSLPSLLEIGFDYPLSVREALSYLTRVPPVCRSTRLIIYGLNYWKMPPPEDLPTFPHPLPFCDLFVSPRPKDRIAFKEFCRLLKKNSPSLRTLTLKDNYHSEPRVISFDKLDRNAPTTKDA